MTPDRGNAQRRERHVGQAFKLIWSLVDEISLTTWPTDRTIEHWLKRLDEARKVMAEGIGDPHE